MTKTKKSALALGGAAAAVAGAVAAVLYSTAYSSFYDKAIHHYNATPLVTAFVVMFALAVAIALVTAACFRKAPPLAESAPNQIESFILWFAAFMFFFFGVLSFSSTAGAGSDMLLQGDAAFGVLGKFCNSASAPLAILTAIALVCSVASPLRGTVVHRVSSIIPVLLGSCMLLKYYFDLQHAPLNDPEVVLTSVCTAAMTLLFIFEARYTLGIATPALSVFCILTCLSLTGFISAARIYLSITAGHTTPPLMENIIFFSVASLALVRLISLPEKLAPGAPALEANADVIADADASVDASVDAEGGEE